MGREGSDEVQFSRVSGIVQEAPVHFLLHAHLASTPPTSRIARLTTPPSGSTFSSSPPTLSLSEPPCLTLNLPYILTMPIHTHINLYVCIYRM